MRFDTLKIERDALPAGFAARIAEVAAPGTLVTEEVARQSYLAEERGLFRSEAEIVAAPASTEELSRIVTLCFEAGVPVVPQGGNTGLVGGAVASRGEVLISLRRMNRVLEVDAENFTITAEAGCILADLQTAARGAGCFFPLSLGAEGSCTIGGNVASNAGGVGVLKYGSTRDLTLGLEVVLPDGSIWNGLRPLHKDNTGYSLKNLFVGSEGTIGIVTRAVLKLFPEPRQRETAFCALNSPADALALLALARRRSGDDVTAFELMSRFSLDIVVRHAGGQDPFTDVYPWYALIELSTPRSGGDLRGLFEALIEEAFDAGLVANAVIADSIERAQRLARLREATPEAQKRAGGSIKHDVSVPVSCIPQFIEEASAAVTRLIPGCHVCAFGHVGDGNVHFNITQPDGMDRAAFLDRWGEVNERVHACVARLNGSISAEHGIGLLKVEEINHYRSAVETRLQATLKRAFDPDNIMNPGKLIVARSFGPHSRTSPSP